MKFIGIWILNPLKTSGGQPVALGGFVVWLGGYFLAWVLIDTFFLLLAAKVRSSCEEGPGQSALQSAYHDPQLDVTELKQHRTT